MDWENAWMTCVGAIVFSVLGAAVPAARAADIDPVRALRYE
jgi:ABC-type lipoprotein release transport system permease subunit